MYCDKMPPSWVTKLVQRIADDHECVPPYVVWALGKKKKYSTGWAAVDGRSIGVTAGSDKVDQRYTIIHEMTHLVLMQHGGTTTHIDEFYHALWPMVRKYRGVMQHALNYECEHHPKSVLHTYKASGGRLTPGV